MCRRCSRVGGCACSFLNSTVPPHSHSATQTYTASGDIALMEEEVRKNTTPAYRAPEVRGRYDHRGDLTRVVRGTHCHTPSSPFSFFAQMWDLFSRDFIGLKVDVWALGCLCFFLCFGRLPFDGDAKLQILNGQYSIPEHAPGSLKRLLRGMLTVDVGRRWDINMVGRGEACAHGRRWIFLHCPMTLI